MLKNVEVIPFKVAAYNKYIKKIEFFDQEDGKRSPHIEMISGT